jgi:hypothetical protein
MPSLSFSSSAMRSSPHVRLSCAISRINSRRFFGSRGRPRFRDFHLQNVRYAVRCHLRNVCGLTMTRASRQSKNLESKTNESACSSVRTSRPQLAFLKQSELFPTEQVLSDEGGTGGKEQANEREQATFYKSLQDLLSVSEGRISFLRRTGRVWAEKERNTGVWCVR